GRTCGCDAGGSAQPGTTWCRRACPSQSWHFAAGARGTISPRNKVGRSAHNGPFAGVEHTFYSVLMERDALFEIARRTFDTPGFRGIEFIEVEAKSVINHVPGTFLPFNWTINPYRGCSHACHY